MCMIWVKSRLINQLIKNRQEKDAIADPYL